MRGHSGSLASNLRTLFDFGTLSGLSDAELLDRVVIRGDVDPALAASAFEVLVLRHGPMVLRVCRLQLRDTGDVEDAFQATFLIFARRLGSIRRRGSVASWLHGVARRVSARARVEAARRGRVEGPSVGMVGNLPSNSVRPDEAFDREEAEALVDEEVGRLPGRYREVIVLCYWEGLTQEEAAVRLGCPIGTVRSRSARARDLLRTRLVRRGLAPASAALAGILGQDSALALSRLPQIPASLAGSTVRACVAIASGLPTRKVASGSILLLTESILRSLMMIKIKTIVLATAVIGLGFLASGRGDQPKPDPQAKLKRSFGRVAPQSNKPDPAEQKEAQPKPKPGLGVPPDYVVEPPDLIVVEVLDALPGRPLNGERLVRPDGRVSLGYYGDVYVAGLTIEQVKEKVVNHLRKYLNDDTLGLVSLDESTTPSKKLQDIAPKDSNRVFVDVTAFNSKFYYIQGEVAVPGRLPVTGNETILDAINHAGGLMNTADRKEALLLRKSVDGKKPEKLVVNLEEVMMGGDPTTNYHLMPGDRLVVRRDRALASQEQERRKQDDAMNTLRDLDQRVKEFDGRLKDLDRKLDRVLEKLGE